MIKSMTGYGKHVADSENRKVTVEIRALNSKQLDLNLRLPQLMKEREIEIRKQIGVVLQRGKIDVSIEIEQNSLELKSVINIDLAKHYYAELKMLSEAINQENFNDYLSIILKMPEVLVEKESNVNDEELDSVTECLNYALIAIDQFRTNEGTVLAEDIGIRISNILNHLTEVDKYENQRIINIKNRIAGNISKFWQDPSTDNNRFEQEIIYYIEKLDITEEKVRLKNNCDYFLENLNNDESSGKKLGFIAQEIGREINTLGSKANDSDLQRIVVLMKDELEKIKEQLFNIL
ncbi:MAG: YicC family protein [Bacteroidetes bacterium]|nr:YicC family protein [Bacteroidota bacterium]MBL6944241.1 YicC family protein [Bacteroidales bacterium]